MFRLWGRNTDEAFYEMLHQQALLNRQAAESLNALAGDIRRTTECVNLLLPIHDSALHVARDLLAKTNATFLTPLDKEDLEALCMAQARVPRWILQAAYRIVHYQLTTARPELSMLTGLLQQMGQKTEDALAHLKKGARHVQLHEVLTANANLRQEADRGFLQAVAGWLNEPGTDPILAIKWKDVYDSIQNAQTRFLDVAEHIEIVLVKYA